MNPRSKSPILTGIKFLVVFGLLSLAFGCTPQIPYKCPEGPKLDKINDSTWLLADWNIHFTDHYDSIGRDSVKMGYAKFFQDYISHCAPKGVHLNFKWEYCICDTTLANIYATVIGASGGSIPKPPTNPPSGPTGDYAQSTNIRFDLPEPRRSDSADPFIQAKLRNSGRADQRILAVIDTGLDTAKIASDGGTLIWANNLLWMDGSRTIFNFVPRENPSLLNDKNLVKHGTSVSLFALEQFPQTMPKIMSLKVFDKNDQATIFTVSCAMSYAIQHNVSAINASLGYYGEEDAVMKHYFEMANKKFIPVFVAAGNDLVNVHNNPYDEDVIVPGNKLTPDHRFYPACFSLIMPNVATITSLNNMTSGNVTKPCKYQNYSEQVVTLGVLNRLRDHPPTPGICCQNEVPYMHDKNLEGSSFATPIAAGVVMNWIANTPPSGEPLREYIDHRASKYPKAWYTIHGNYIDNFIIR